MSNIPTLLRGRQAVRKVSARWEDISNLDFAGRLDPLCLCRQREIGPCRLVLGL